MRTAFGKHFEWRSPYDRVSVADPALFASKPRISRFRATRLLRIQQSPSDHVQIGERGRDLQPVQVLRQAPVTDFLEAEDPLDHTEHVLDLGADPRLVTVRGLDLLRRSGCPSDSAGW